MFRIIVILSICTLYPLSLGAFPPSHDPKMAYMSSDDRQVRRADKNREPNIDYELRQAQRQACKGECVREGKPTDPNHPYYRMQKFMGNHD